MTPAKIRVVYLITLSSTNTKGAVGQLEDKIHVQRTQILISKAYALKGCWRGGVRRKGFQPQACFVRTQLQPFQLLPQDLCLKTPAANEHQTQKHPCCCSSRRFPRLPLAEDHSIPQNLRTQGKKLANIERQSSFDWKSRRQVELEFARRYNRLMKSNVSPWGCPKESALKRSRFLIHSTCQTQANEERWSRHHCRVWHEEDV